MIYHSSAAYVSNRKESGEETLSASKRKLRLLADRVGRNMDIDTFESLLLQMDSSGTIRIKGCISTETYTVQEIVLFCRYGEIRILGSDLKLPVYSESETVISGQVSGLHFCWNEVPHRA